MTTTISKSGLSEYINFCRNLPEHQGQKLLEKVEGLFQQISRIDDTFNVKFENKMKTIDSLDRRQVLDDYSNKVPINEIILSHPKFDERVFMQVFAEKIKNGWLIL
uniref:Uncharacterized protein n=1 Tax=Panagrolaimus sp. JU765 TaxID=591449 RepID=A0AC34RQH8_9BILA